MILRGPEDSIHAVLDKMREAAGEYWVTPIRVTVDCYVHTRPDDDTYASENAVWSYGVNVYFANGLVCSIRKGCGPESPRIKTASPRS